MSVQLLACSRKKSGYNPRGRYTTVSWYKSYNPKPQVSFCIRIISSSSVTALFANNMSKLFLCLILHILYVTSTISSPNKERTFVMIKPDGVQRGLVGKIIQRFEEKGFKLVAQKFVKADDKLLRTHYAALKDKPFFESLIKYMSSGKTEIFKWAVNLIRSEMNSPNFPSRSAGFDSQLKEVKPRLI